MDRTRERHINVICSMAYQRADRTVTPGVRSVRQPSILRVVDRYNFREGTDLTLREVLNASTDRWLIQPSADGGLFLVSQKSPEQS